MKTADCPPEECRKEWIDPAISDAQGRIIKTTGDGRARILQPERPPYPLSHWHQSGRRGGHRGRYLWRRGERCCPVVTNGRTGRPVHFGCGLSHDPVPDTRRVGRSRIAVDQEHLAANPCLARKLTVPVLVMHSEGDKRVPPEEGRRLAALTPGARFVTLPGNNHAVMAGTPAYDLFVQEFHRFVDAHAS